MRLMRLIQMLSMTLVWVLGWAILLPQPVEAHTGEGFHLETLWALLRTTLYVALAIAAWIGVLWLYRRYKS